jgi:hypothetical protein
MALMGLKKNQEEEKKHSSQIVKWQLFDRQCWNYKQVDQVV